MHLSLQPVVHIPVYCSSGQNSFAFRVLNLPWLHGGCVQLIYRMGARKSTTMVKGICVPRSQCLKPKEASESECKLATDDQGASWELWGRGMVVVRES